MPFLWPCYLSNSKGGSVGPPLWSRLTDLCVHLIDCRETFYKHLWSPEDETWCWSPLFIQCCHEVDICGFRQTYTSIKHLTTPRLSNCMYSQQPYLQAVLHGERFQTVQSVWTDVSNCENISKSGEWDKVTLFYKTCCLDAPEQCT